MDVSACSRSGAGQVAVLAVEDDRVAGVPLLDHLQAAVDLAA